MLSGNNKSSAVEPKSDEAAEKKAEKKIGSGALKQLASMTDPGNPQDYKLKDAWADFKNFLDAYEAADKPQASNEKDEAAFEFVSGQINKCYEHGAISNNTEWKLINLLKIVNNGKKAANIIDDTFSHDESVMKKKESKAVEKMHDKISFEKREMKEKPAQAHDKKIFIFGAKSAHYHQMVVIPFLEKMSQVKHEDWLVYVCSFKFIGRDLVKKSHEAAEIAEKFKAIAAQFNPVVQRKSASDAETLKIVGQFAAPVGSTAVVNDTQQQMKFG